DLSNHKSIVVPGGVTIASGRGINNSKGALIYTNTAGVSPPFKVGGATVVFFGLSISVTDTDIYPYGKKLAGKENDRRNVYRKPVTVGIGSSFSYLIVENCELFGWTHGAISLEKGADNVIIHHNYIHHNRRYGLGYGVVLDGAS